MVAAVAPYIDAAISKTVNVAEEYPYEDFKNLYMEAWKKGLKGITTYRPNNVRTAILSVPTEKEKETKKEDKNGHSVTLSEQDKRIILKEVTIAPPLSSLRLAVTSCAASRCFGMDQRTDHVASGGIRRGRFRP